MQPSFIRVEADEETTSCTSAAIRAEMDMIAGKVKVATCRRMERALRGVPGGAPTNDKWACCKTSLVNRAVRYYRTYALGKLWRAVLWQGACSAPKHPDEIASGKFDTLLGWLREHPTAWSLVHDDELTQRITGECIDRSTSYSI